MIKTQTAQKGIVLLLMLFLLFGVGVSIVLSTWNNSAYKQAKEQQTQLALRQAREAVIAWATTRKGSGFPGQLPCPEDTSLIGQPNEGKAFSSCSNSTTQIGRVAWKTLGLDRPLDADGEQLWYILSPGYRNLPPPGTVAIPTGQLQLDGIPNSAAAIIIAPGPPLTGQNRSTPSSTSPPQASDYLDLGNAGGPAFISTGQESIFNDRLLTITSQDLFQALKHRALADISGSFGNATGLRRYYNDFGQYPWADINGDGIADPGQALGIVPYSDLAASGALIGLTWLNSWFTSVTYKRLSANKAELSIGASMLSVTP